MRLACSFWLFLFLSNSVNAALVDYIDGATNLNTQVSVSPFGSGLCDATGYSANYVGSPTIGLFSITSQSIPDEGTQCGLSGNTDAISNGIIEWLSADSTELSFSLTSSSFVFSPTHYGTSGGDTSTFFELESETAVRIAYDGFSNQSSFGGAFNSINLLQCNSLGTGCISIISDTQVTGLEQLSLTLAPGFYLLSGSANGNATFTNDYDVVEVFGEAGISATVTFVPIPAAVWLFASALAGLGWIRRAKTV